MGLKSNNIVDLDKNPGMLQVASEIEPYLNWKPGSSEDLPFSEKTFDRVVCQFGMMFFQNKSLALDEMIRVKKSDGLILVSIWDKIENNEGYFDLLQLVDEVIGVELGEVLKAPFNLGEVNNIQHTLQINQTVTFKIETIQAQIEFPSIKNWIDCDIKASPIAKLITEDQYDLLLTKSEDKLSKYLNTDGAVQFNMSAHFILIY